MTEHWHNDSKRNQVNIAILGAVSAGKSTLLNTIFANTYSECKIKRTTMTPQIYLETDKLNTRAAKKIIENNSIINKKLIELSESGEVVTQNDIKEVYHLVPKVHDFLELEKDIYLTIYDIPGLNDGRTKDVYFEYIENNFNKFDIIIFVVDINSALNTSDEVAILEKIINNCKINNECHGIHNKLIILANKCDEMSLSDEKILILEEEHAEMMLQLKKLVDEKINNIFPTLEYDIKPISCEDSYIYRMYNKNPEFELDMKYLNKFGYNEYGKTRWNKLTESVRRHKIKELLNEIDMNETMGITGFNGFKHLLNSYLNPENQKIYINNHISQGISKINNNTKIDISDDIQMFYNFSQQYKSLEKRITSGINTTEIFKTMISKYMETWNINIIMGFIYKIQDNHLENKDFKWGLKQESFIPQIEEAKDIIDNACRLFNGDIPIITELNNNITDSLNNYYVSDINNKTKSITTLFNHLSKLVSYGYNITKNLIDNLFNNQNMIKQSPFKIIEYLEKLELDGFITNEYKKEKVLDIISDIYKHLSLSAVTEFPEYIADDDIYLYLYYSNMFWSKYIMFNEIPNLFIEKIHTIGFLSSSNQIKYMSLDIYKKSFNFNYKKSCNLLLLENYYICLIENKPFEFPEEYNPLSITDDKITNTLDNTNILDNTITDFEVIDKTDGNISDELDIELGLNRTTSKKYKNKHTPTNNAKKIKKKK
jgi:predicted GTPase